MDRNSDRYSPLEIFLSIYNLVCILLVATFYPFSFFFIFLTFGLFILFGVSIVSFGIAITKIKKIRKAIGISTIVISSVVIIILSIYIYYEFQSTLEEVPSINVVKNSVINSEDIPLLIENPGNYIGYNIELDAKVVEIHKYGLGIFKNPYIWALIYGNSTWFEISFNYSGDRSNNAYVYIEKRLNNIQVNSHIKIKGIILGETQKYRLIFRPKKLLFIKALNIE